MGTHDETPAVLGLLRMNVDPAGGDHVVAPSTDPGPAPLRHAGQGGDEGSTPDDVLNKLEQSVVEGRSGAKPRRRSSVQDVVSVGGREDWRRLGDAVHAARLELGYTNRETFAEAAGVSPRTLADLESGGRTNFSGRVLGSVESVLGWPSGTLQRIASDPDFTTPATGGLEVELVFKAPIFSRRPVLQDVALIERSIITLTEAARAADHRGDSSPTQGKLAAALVSQCWPYIARLVEQNCIPGRELHPAVRPIYDTFTAVADRFAPDDPNSHYTKFLAGDDTDVTDAVKSRYKQRMNAARREAHGGGEDPDSVVFRPRGAKMSNARLNP
jgi:hypothetical protein